MCKGESAPYSPSLFEQTVGFIGFLIFAYFFWTMIGNAINETIDNSPFCANPKPFLCLTEKICWFNFDTKWVELLCDKTTWWYSFNNQYYIPSFPFNFYIRIPFWFAIEAFYEK